ncbi:hypothetical protein D7322_16005 [Sphingobacterium puteale]|uniref:Uncharacterized protein n=1 Tax=Sphingobacterium puteale TaxID=2420510 RepID=A0A420VWP4_9SPHI|nr:hypothetical protein D7322_16005 [Sphingobacterium puteale]
MAFTMKKLPNNNVNADTPAINFDFKVFITFVFKLLIFVLHIVFTSQYAIEGSCIMTGRLPGSQLSG